MLRSSIVVLLLVVAAPASALEPVTGPWEGERVRARVAEGASGFALTQVNVSYTDRCTHPDTGKTNTVGLDVDFARLPIAKDGTFSGVRGKTQISGRFTSRRRATATFTAAPEAEGCTGATRSLVLTPLEGTGQAPGGGGAPVLERFRATGRIASGRVAGYDLREEAEDFEYRIRAERVEARVQRRASGTWVTLGTVKARPPAPLDFWPIFKNMGNGTYRILARAQTGKSFSKPKIVRFEVVSHIPHSD